MKIKFISVLLFFIGYFHSFGQCPLPTLTQQAAPNSQTTLKSVCSSPYQPVWYKSPNFTTVFATTPTIVVPTNTIVSYYSGCKGEVCLSKLVNIDNRTNDPCLGAVFAYISTTYTQGVTSIPKPTITSGNVAGVFSISPTNPNIKIDPATGAITLTANNTVSGTFVITNTVTRKAPCSPLVVTSTQTINIVACALPFLVGTNTTTICSGTAPSSIKYAITQGCGTSVKVYDGAGNFVQNLSGGNQFFSPGALTETTTYYFECSTNSCGKKLPYTYKVYPTFDALSAVASCKDGKVSVSAKLKAAKSATGNIYEYRILSATNSVVVGWTNLGTIPSTGLSTLFTTPGFVMPNANQNLTIEIRIKGSENCPNSTQAIPFYVPDACVVCVDADVAIGCNLGKPTLFFEAYAVDGTKPIIQFKLDNGVWQNVSGFINKYPTSFEFGNYDYSIDISSGTHTVSFQVAGSPCPPKVVTFTTPCKPPCPIIVALNQLTCAGGPVCIPDDAIYLGIQDVGLEPNQININAGAYQYEYQLDNGAWLPIVFDANGGINLYKLGFGTHTLKLRIKGSDCVVTKTFTLIKQEPPRITTDVNVLKEQTKLYPNPVTGTSFTLEVPEGTWNITILSSTGTVIRTWEGVSAKMLVNVDGFRTGTYYVRISNSAASYTVTFAK